MPYTEPSVYTGESNPDPDLNFDLYAEQLCKIAIKATANSTEAFTVGIFGSWGSGKTTLMKLIRSKLKNPQKIFSQNDHLGKTICKSIWVNPWKYDSKEEVKNSLIQTILREMANDEKDEVKRQQIMENALKLGLSIARLGGYTLRGTIKAVTSGGIDTKYIADEVEKAIKGGDNNSVVDPYRFINHFEETFQGLVKAYVGEQGRLIIFIDDLDRCLPENTLAVLESLKLYLAQVNCIFFIGLDKRVIEQAVSQRYKEIKITGKEYIEKIIRLNFFLPDKDPDEVKQIFKYLPMTIGKYDGEGSDKEKEEAQKLWNMIVDATKGNLRKIEQFIIAFELIEQIVEGLNKKRRPNQPEGINWKNTYPMLAKILLIQMNFPDFYDCLEKNHALMAQIKRVYDGSKSRDKENQPKADGAESGDAKSEDKENQQKAVQDKYPLCEDPKLIEFIVKHFDYGEISSSENWKVIHKLSKAVVYE